MKAVAGKAAGVYSWPCPPRKASQAFGFFDVELRVQWLLAKGNPLSRLDAVVDWERFHPWLDAALVKPAQGPGGRASHDRLKRFKTLVVQRFFDCLVGYFFISGFYKIYSALEK